MEWDPERDQTEGLYKSKKSWCGTDRTPLPQTLLLVNWKCRAQGDGPTGILGTVVNIGTGPVNAGTINYWGESITVRRIFAPASRVSMVASS